MKFDLNSLTRRFLLGESFKKPSMRALAESVVRILDEVQVRARSQRENRQLSIARQHLLEIKSLSRQLENKVVRLEEQVKILEEGK